MTASIEWSTFESIGSGRTGMRKGSWRRRTVFRSAVSERIRQEHAVHLATLNGFAKINWQSQPQVAKGLAPLLPRVLPPTGASVCPGRFCGSAPIRSHRCYGRSAGPGGGWRCTSRRSGTRIASPGFCRWGVYRSYQLEPVQSPGCSPRSLDDLWVPDARPRQDRRELCGARDGCHDHAMSGAP